MSIPTAPLLSQQKTIPTSTQKQKKRKLSIGEIPLADIPTIEEKFESMLDDIKHFASSSGGKWNDLEDVDNLQKYLRTVIVSIKDLKSLREEEINKSRDVKVIPFSKFNHSLLSTHLGIKLIYIKAFTTMQGFQTHLNEAVKVHQVRGFVMTGSHPRNKIARMPHAYLLKDGGYIRDPIRF